MRSCVITADLCVPSNSCDGYDLVRPIWHYHWHLMPMRVVRDPEVSIRDLEVLLPCYFYCVTVFIVMFISQPALNIPDRRSLLGGPSAIAALAIGTHISKNDRKMISSRRGTANSPHRQQRDLQQIHYT